MSTMTRSFLLCSLIVLSAQVLLFGQSGATGTILGTVTDNSGAVVANAKVATHQPRNRGHEKCHNNFVR